MGLRRSLVRLGATGVTLAAAALLVAPGSAAARPADPVAHTCDTTHNKDDQPPIVDPSAAFDRLLGIELGSWRDVLPLPLTSTRAPLERGASEAITDPLDQVCDATRDSSDTLADTAREALRGALPGLQRPGDAESDDPGTGQHTGPDFTDGNPGAGQTGTAGQQPPLWLGAMGPQSGGAVPGWLHGSAGNSSDPAGAAPLGEVWTPPTSTAAPGDPGDQAQEMTADSSGAAHALPGPGTPERLPLSLAVVVLILVGSMLARTWLRRTP